mmetsp:Transcript_25928/g.48893  ORF Transcript_25928/g.48893 Transcript_25928/m.48893 type:complete len:108 (-) Transcript_25928:16-339(-)
MARSLRSNLPARAFLLIEKPEKPRSTTRGLVISQSFRYPLSLKQPFRWTTPYSGISIASGVEPVPAAIHDVAVRRTGPGEWGGKKVGRREQTAAPECLMLLAKVNSG